MAFALEIVDSERRVVSYRYLDVVGMESRFRAVEVSSVSLSPQLTVLMDSDGASVVPMGGRGCISWNAACLKRVFNSGCAHGGCAWLAWNLKLTAACLIATCGISVWNCCAKFATPDPWDFDSIGDPVEGESFERIA